MMYSDLKISWLKLSLASIFGSFIIMGFAACSPKISTSGTAYQDTLKQTSEQKTNKYMTEIQARAITALTLPEQDYFRLNNNSVVPVQQRFSKALSNDDPFSNSPASPGEPEQFFVIKTPPVIDEGKYQTIPLLIGSAQTGLHHWEVSYEANTASILTNLENGEVHIQWPFTVKKRTPVHKPSMYGPRPDTLNATAMLRGVRYCDMRMVNMDYKWIPATYALTLIDYDWVSNTEIFELRSPGAKVSSPVPAQRYKQLYSSLKANNPATLQTNDNFSFKISDKIDVNQPIYLELSINMPFAETGLTQLVEVNGKAELPIAVMLFQKDSDYPVLLNFSVPVIIETLDGKEYIKYLESLDLAKGLNTRQLAGEYLVYINVGKNLYGPKRISIGK